MWERALRIGGDRVDDAARYKSIHELDGSMIRFLLTAHNPKKYGRKKPLEIFIKPSKMDSDTSDEEKEAAMGREKRYNKIIESLGLTIDFDAIGDDD